MLNVIFDYFLTISYTDLILIVALAVLMFLAGGHFRASSIPEQSTVDEKMPENKAIVQELALLKDILNKSPNMVFVKNKQLQTIFANIAFADAVNKKPEDLYGKTDIENGWSSELVFGKPQKTIQGFEKDDLVVLDGKIVQNYAQSSIFDDVEYFYDTIKMPLHNENGDIVAVLGLSQNVTERVRLENIQKYNSDFQHLITNLATEFINLSAYEFDTGVNHMLKTIGEFIGAGRTYIYHFADNLSRATMVHEWTAVGTEPQMLDQQNLSTQPFGITFNKFRRGEHEFIPNVFDMPESRQVEKDRLIAQGITARITFPLMRDGEVLGSMGFHAVSGEANWANNTVDLLKIVAELYINLLNRKEIQEKVNYQASLLKNVTDAIFATDLDMTITSWNDAAEIMYGYSAEEIIGHKLPEMIESDYLGLDREDVVQAFLENQRWKGELIRYHKDGTAINVLTSVSALKDVNGVMIGAVSVNHDISERKYLEAQQTEFTIQTERVQLLEQVIGDLSHDIKTPLSSLHVNLYLLRKQKNEEKRLQYLDRMENNLNHLNKLVEDILMMTRLDKGAKLVFQSTDLNTLVKTLALQHQGLSKREKPVTFDLSPELKPILCSPPELNQVFSNLIDNAVAYSSSDKAIIIRTYAKEFQNVIEIQDFGIGIDEKDLLQIFERFYRADKARNASQGGTGLGLTIVQKLVELHNGTITVESIPDVGTTFCVSLPISSE